MRQTAENIFRQISVGYHVTTWFYGNALPFGGKFSCGILIFLAQERGQKNSLLCQWELAK